MHMDKPLTGTEYFQSTFGMRKCTGTIRLMAWKNDGPRPRGQVHVADVVVSKVFWDSKTQGTYVRPRTDK